MNAELRSLLAAVRTLPLHVYIAGSAVMAMGLSGWVALPFSRAVGEWVWLGLTAALGFGFGFLHAPRSEDRDETDTTCREDYP